MKPTLLILAAGMGSRYGGLKQIDSMGPSGEVIMDYSIFDAIRANFGKIVFVIRHDFEEEFRVKVGNKYAHMLPVEYAFQDLNDIPAGFKVPEGREKPWGTSHAILSARNVIKEPFAMVNADDFYGAESYEIVGNYLSKVDPATNEWCMSGYKLCNVLSEYGGVTRAICRTDENDYLTRIEEMFKIVKDGDHCKGCNKAEEWREIGLQDLTSMNFFGFTPGIFKLLEEGFVTFLEKEGTAMKSEYLIPTSVNDLIGAGKGHLKCLATNGKWFGVTYPEDKPIVQKNIQALVDAGKYPTPLFK